MTDRKTNPTVAAVVDLSEEELEKARGGILKMDHDTKSAVLDAGPKGSTERGYISNTATGTVS